MADASPRAGTHRGTGAHGGAAMPLAEPDQRLRLATGCRGARAAGGSWLDRTLTQVRPQGGVHEVRQRAVFGVGTGHKAFFQGGFHTDGQEDFSGLWHDFTLYLYNAQSTLNHPVAQSKTQRGTHQNGADGNRRHKKTGQVLEHRAGYHQPIFKVSINADSKFTASFQVLHGGADMSAYLVIEVAVPGGAQSFVEPLEALTQYLANPQQFEASLLGLSEADHAVYVEQEGRVRCAELTAKGRRCKRLCNPPDQSVGTWKEKYDSGMYCHVHDGGRT